jgi:hypothetical protein
VFATHQLLDPGDMVQVHAAGNEGRHAQSCWADIDLGVQGGHIYLRKKFHCVHTQGLSSPVRRTIDPNQLGLSVFRQAQPKIE